MSYEPPDEEEGPEPEEYEVDVPARAPAGRRTPRGELVRGRRLTVRRGQLMVPAGPTPAATRDLPAPLTPMQAIPAPQPEAASTAQERRRWQLAFPFDGDGDERRRAVDQFVVDLEKASSEASHIGGWNGTMMLRHYGYRQSAIDDYRQALDEREGQARVRRMLQRARRYGYWARALQTSVEIFLGVRDP